MLLVSRLDGPDTATVYRIINDTIKAEENASSECSTLRDPQSSV